MTDRQILNIYNRLKETGATEQQIIDTLKKKGIDLEAMRAGKELFTPSEIQKHLRYNRALDYKENPEQYQGESKLSSLLSIPENKKEEKERSQEVDKFGQYLVDIFREVGQGATWGGADELEAYLRSKTGGGTYDDELDIVRGKVQKFRDSPQNKQLEILGMNPSTAGEVTGALTVPFALSAKLASALPWLGQIKSGQWVQNLIKRGLIGSVTGAADMYAYGVGTGEGNIHDRMTSDKAIEYAKFGGKVGAPLGVLGYGIEKAANKLASHGVKGNRESMQSVISANKMDNLELQDLSDYLDEIIKRGDTEIAEHMTLADLGKPGGMMQRSAEVVSQASPPVMAEATQTFAERASRFPEFARKQVKKFLGPRVHDADQFKKRIFRFAKSMAQPHYDLADPIMVDLPKVASEINRIMNQTDNVGKMVKKAWAKTKLKYPQLVKKKMGRGVDMSIEGFGPWGTSGVAPPPKDRAGGETTIMFYDTLKQYLDQELSTMAKSIKGDTLAKLDEGELLGLRKLLNESLQDSSESYKKATGIWENAHNNNNAFKMGMDAHKNTTISAKTVRTNMNGFKSDAEKKAYRLGYGYGMYGKIQNANLAMANESKILRLFSEEEPEKLKALFRSPEIALDFIKKIKTIGDMDYFGKQVLKGSQTFQRREIEKLLQDEPSMVTKALDTVQSMRGAPRVVGNIAEALENDATKNRMAGMGPYLSRPGIDNMRKGLADLTEEERRWMLQKKDRSKAPVMLPSLLPSSGAGDWVPQEFDNLGIPMF